MANNRSKRKTKIKNKLLLFLVPAVVITILALVIISAYLSRTSLEEKAVAELESSISNQTDNIESWLNQNLQDFAAVKNMITNTQRINVLKDLLSLANAIHIRIPTATASYRHPVS